MGLNCSDSGAKDMVALLGTANFRAHGPGSPASTSRHSRVLAVSLTPPPAVTRWATVVFTK